MSDEIPTAANDSDGGSGPPPARRADLKALGQAISSILAEADRLELPFVSLRLDHAHELCLAEIARLEREP